MTDGRRRMRDVTHAHPDHDPRAWHWFARGPTVAADGGERREAPRTPSDRGPDGSEPSEARRASSGRESDGPRNVEEEHIRDVSHEPATGDGANRVWERGESGRDDEDGA